MGGSGYLHKQDYTPLSFEDMRALHALPPNVTQQQYENSVTRYKALQELSVSQITYLSDGLKVTGIEVLPDFATNEKAPLIIFNRGGSGNFSMLDASAVIGYMAPFATRMRAGVLASNYRGNAGSEGREEWGGADVNDIKNLIVIGKQQPWWDGVNIFMLGWSRGGMMTYLALKGGSDVNAAAVGAGASNLFLGNDLRPEMDKVCARFIPNYNENRDAALQVRSAYCWPEQLHTPTLILHGDADWRVNVQESRELVHKLQELGKPVKYIEFPEGDHILSQYRTEMTDAVIEWFNQHRI